MEEDSDFALDDPQSPSQGFLEHSSGTWPWRPPVAIRPSAEIENYDSFTLGIAPGSVSRFTN